MNHLVSVNNVNRQTSRTCLIITMCVQMNNDVESLVRDMLRPHWARGAAAAVVTQSPPGDLPPKYEDLGQSSQPILSIL